MRAGAVLAAAAVLLSTACSSGAAPTPGAPGTGSAAATASAAGFGTAPSGTDWPTYHRDAARTGASEDVATFSGVDAAWQSEPLDGDVYAEPLVVGGRAIVATERNSVYAFDARTGTRQWRTTLGAPVDASTLPCGNIRPVSGITGTPVADAGTGLAYVVAFEQPAHHELYAIDLASGAIRFHRSIDPPGADPRVHQQRAALALANGNVYVAYGGLLGDCGNYRGAVVGARADAAGGELRSYVVPATRQAGIWAPSGIAVDANGRLYVATGNSASSGDYDYNDAILRLSPDLALEDYWAPTDWLALSRSDTDIGSIGPTLVGNGLLVAAGKNGVVYLLRADALGHVGGEVAKLHVCGGVFGGFAYAARVAYVPCVDGIAAVQIAADQTLRLLWRAQRGVSGPPILAAGALWATDPSGATLYALDLSSGRQRLQRSVGAMQHFTTPTAFADLILVAAGGRLVALRLR